MARAEPIYIDCGPDERRENARCIIQLDAAAPTQHELQWYGFADGLSVWLYPGDSFTFKWCKKKRIRRKKISVFDLVRQAKR